MLERARRIRDYIEGKTYEEYASDRQLQDAVERCVEVIGEAARQIPRSFRDSHPELPWHAIIAQRHVLAHDYADIAAQRIHRVATVHVPELIEQLAPMLDRLSLDEDDA